MKKLTLFFCLLISPLIHAQELITKESLLNNKDISWLGEYLVKMPFDLNTDQIDTVNINYNKFLSAIKDVDFYWECRAMDVYPDKYFNNLNLNYFKNDFRKRMDVKQSFAAYLVESVKKNKITVYKDSELKEAYSKEEVTNLGNSIDTLITFDAETFEEKLSVVVLEPNPNNFLELGAHVYVYYNQKTFSWHLVCKSVSIVLKRFDALGNMLGDAPLFWMPVYNYSSTLDYTQPQFTYANKTAMGITFLEDKEDKKGIKTALTQLKSAESFEKCNERMIEQIRNNPTKHEIYITDDNYTSKLTLEEVKNIGVSSDSLFVLNPETFEEIVQVVESKLDVKNLKKIRFNQLWYWDNKEKKLKMSALGFAPIVNQYDRNTGDFLYSGPIFWKKTYEGKDNISGNN
jgi:hypothetical protein